MAKSRRIMVTVPPELADQMEAAAISPSRAIQEGIRVLLGSSELAAPPDQLRGLDKRISRLARELGTLKRRQDAQEAALLAVVKRMA